MAIVNKDWWQGKYGPLLIAEIGGNHEGNFQKAKKLLKLCSKLGVDVVKFQIYQGANLINRDISPKKFEHFKKFELTKKQHIFLANEAKRLGMKYLSSVWTKKDLSWIAPKMDYFKIGSGDLTTYEIIDEICKYEKPIIISTGLSKLQEVNDTIKFIKSRKKFYKKSCNLAILQCTSTYPTKTSEVNLDVISKFKKKKLITGYSHHHLGIYPIELAFTLGAEIIEFHFTDSKKNRKFRDHQISLNFNDVKKLKKKLLLIKTLKGDSSKKPTKQELLFDYRKIVRRGIYINKDVKKGKIITKNDIICLRPERSLSSKYYFQILNKKIRRDIKKFEEISLKDFIL